MNSSNLNNNLLFETILARDLSGLERLIAAKVNVNQIWELKSTTPLIEAIKLGWFDGIFLLIKAGADINLKSHFVFEKCTFYGDSITPLELAVYLDNLEIVKLLIIHGANPDSGWFPLYSAVNSGSVDVVLALIDAVKKVNRVCEFGLTPLMRAACLGRLELVKILCSANANVNLVEDDSKETALVMAASSGHKDIFDYLFPLTTCPFQRKHAQKILSRGIVLKQRKNNKLLCDFLLAAFQGNMDVVQEALIKGVDVNAFGVDGESALHVAARCGNSVIIQILLKAGADIEMLTENNQNTSLMIACDCGNQEAVNILIANKAKLNIFIAESTPLMKAARGNYLEIVKVLISAGIDINAKNKNKWTALMFAARDSHPDIVKVLINAGADIDAKNKDGWTALMFAAKSRNLEAYNFLIGAGADINAKNNEGLDALYYLDLALTEIPF